jgi:hypothetical protein
VTANRSLRQQGAFNTSVFVFSRFARKYENKNKEFFARRRHQQQGKRGHACGGDEEQLYE